jgi:dTDP-4-amino-4,6-dideoxygalactose transaminase
MSENIYVTKPYLPPLHDFEVSLREIWESAILTNGGPMHQRLEVALQDYLGVAHLSLFNNGTIALLTAIEAQGLEGEVITTPFSFVATSHALVWTRLTPVFADIDPVTMNLDPDAVEAAITPSTRAILAVHCYGHPCDTARLQAIADRHGLKLVYDAAHAFGVEDSGGSVLRHGDMAALSFHATKVFSTLEGGAVISPNADAKAQIDRLKNFGIESETEVSAVGINGKLNEVQAAFGLLQLQAMDRALDARARVAARYDHALSDVEGLVTCGQSGLARANNAYYPVRITNRFGLSRDALYERLKDYGIFTRRYFYPLISSLPMYRDFPSAAPGNLPVANKIGQEVLCLPIYPDLSVSDQDRIITAIQSLACGHAA